MQIVIPMSGFGERFRRAGYSLPKPMIEIDGKPVIGHVIEMFPNECDFIFICNQQHLDEPLYQMKATLERYCPTGRVVGIPPHKKGPVSAVQQIGNLLDPNRAVLVNYCDFSCYWDWEHFKIFVKNSDCSGAVPAYRGFHPHSLGNTNYAYLKETEGWLSDIQEKRSFTNDRMQEFASSGTYYFASAKIMLDAFEKTIAQDLNVAGEYYVSLAYKALLAQQMTVAVYPLQHFMQWGTPEDVAEYNTWSKAFHGLSLRPPEDQTPSGSLIIPMAGLGKRFSDEGYTLTKPLINVSGLPMVAQSTRDLPPAKEHVFVLRADMPGYEDVSVELRKLYPEAILETIESVTDGQACTALIGLSALEKHCDAVAVPITIGACDNGALYSQKAYRLLETNPDVDVIVWGIRGYPNAIRYPNMFGWINSRNGQILSVSVKTPLENPAEDPILLGTFTFRRPGDFKNAFNRLKDRDGKVNGEFYVDSLINDAIALGLRCYLFEVDSYLCWGTPNDLRTFEYWQSCFHKWHGHQYRLELDRRIPADQVERLQIKYRAIKPDIPAKPK